MTYHLDWTVFLFAHTIAEVLDLAAFVLDLRRRRLHVRRRVGRRSRSSR